MSTEETRQDAAERPTPVPYDPELEPGLAAFLDLVEQIPLRSDTIIANRDHFATIIPPVSEIVGDRPVTLTERTIPAHDGAELEITIVTPTERVERAPGVLCIHGGGMVLGTRFFGIDELISYALDYGAVGVSIEYRLAPEHPAPTQAEDCYSALVWLADHAEELGVDPGRILVTGTSAGGGLSAAVSLMARDRKGPSIAGQLLAAPMLDDRNETVSSLQYDGIGAWDRNNNHTAWEALLPGDRGTERVTPYQAPARAEDLSNLPPAYVDVGAAEVFRDEAVDYALRIWATGGEAELHVWSGGYHGFSGFSPDATVSHAADDARSSWLRRIFGSVS